MTTHDRRHTTTRGKVRACVAALTLAVALAGCAGQTGRPISELLEDRGYAATEVGWTRALTDEQRAAVDAAYKAGVAEGYGGTKEEWLTAEVRYREDEGRVTLVLPDGTELALEDGSFFEDPGTADETRGEASEKDGADREAGAESPATEWADALNEEQRAAMDMAYEASVAEGYGGSKEEWLKSEVESHRDHNGDVVVAFPDGSEMTVSATQAQGAGGEEDGSPASDDPAQKDPGGEAAAEKGTDDASAEGVVLSVKRAEAHPGDADVAVPIRIEGNPGILGLTLSISYDESAMTLRGAESGDAFRDVLSMTRSKEYASGCIFSWDGVEVKDEDVRDGTVLTLYFDMSGNAEPGRYPVSARVGSAVDNSLSPVDVEVRDSNVQVS